MSSRISIKNLHYTYPGDEAESLCGVSLEIEKGSFAAVLGHNGSGKSTLAKHLNAILTPTEGEVLVDGIRTSDEDRLLDIRRTVGMVFQNPDNQIVANVVEDDVAFAPENLGVEPKEIRRRVDNALKQVDMYEFRQHAPHLLSGGQKQRVAIAGVIAMEPEVLILDEPAAGLDPRGREEILGGIRRYQRERRNTVIIVSHSMEDMARYADRITVVSEGALFRTGTPAEIFSDAASLSSVGLDVPQITHVMLRLAELGVPVRGGIYTVADARDELMRLYSERTKK